MSPNNMALSEPEGPIFVVGAPRSGTSIFAWCLGQHPNIVNLPETNWLALLGDCVERLYRAGTVNGKFSHLGAVGISKEAFYARFGMGIERLIQDLNLDLAGAATPNSDSAFQRRRSKDDPKRRWIDATPQNSMSIYALSRLFPEARFIHLLRNPHEVARSLGKMERTGASNYRPREAYQTWLRCTRAACIAERAFGKERMVRVRYEELVANPERVIRYVLDFLREPFNEDCKRPMASKINSSQVDNEPLPKPSKAGRLAEEYYQHITSSAAQTAQHDPAAAYAQMEAEFSARLRGAPSPVARLAGLFGIRR